MNSNKIVALLKNNDILLLTAIYVFGVFIRIAPKLEMDSHLPVFLGDVWYRICMSQYILDYHALPIPDIRYIPYGDVPLWYPPLSPMFYAAISAISNLDLPTVMTRVIPFIEAFTPIPLYFLAKEWFSRNVARLSVLMLAITPSFILYSAIADPQVFTLMVIPIVLIYLSRQKYGYSRNNAIWMGILLGINFMVHLSYFIVVGLMALYIVARKFDKQPVHNELKFLGVAVLISLIISSWWWAPNFLFYWWIWIITTSTLLQTFGSHLTSYGAPFMIMGFIGFGYILVDRLSYFNIRSNYNPWHIISLVTVFSALCGIFMGKTITIPVIAILALLYSLIALLRLKTTFALATAVSAACAIIISGVATWFTTKAGNIGAWTKTFTFIQSAFASDLEAIGLLFITIFIFFILAAAFSKSLYTSPYLTPVIIVFSFGMLVASVYIYTKTSATMGALELIKAYLTGKNTLAIAALISIPTLFIYQYKGKVGKYVLKHQYETFLLFWTIFLLYEVFSENILSIVREYGLMWETTVRPLEGYRFYIFLAQPFSILAAILIMEIRKHKATYAYGFMIFIACLGYFSLSGAAMPDYDMDFKITNSGVFIEDYNAAVWFKANSTQNDRIVADYYAGQMFSGVCAGRALIGGLFPLRNIDFNEYIKAPAQVQDDIYDFYKTEDMDLTLSLANRYGITHVYISDNMASRGWLGSYKDNSFGVPINWTKFFSSAKFNVIYEDHSNPYNNVYILALVK
ncbi:MAG: glycosyltransferase family 39 protein [Candidatus Methanofastidiosia archaeon]